MSIITDEIRSRLLGTLLNVFKINTIQLKNNNDSLALRNDSDTAYIDVEAPELDAGYDSAAIIRSEVPDIARPMVKVELKNLKTGNKYIDSWLDVRLYTMDRQEHPYDVMYCGKRDFFYIGFHARNTKRLPYNVECTIGEEYLSDSEIDSAYMMHKIKNQILTVPVTPVSPATVKVSPS